MRRNAWLIIGLLLVGLWAWSQYGPQATAPAGDTPAASRAPGDHEPLAQPPRAARAGYPAWLPAQALDTLALRSEEHQSELPSLMRNSYAVLCLNNKKNKDKHTDNS